MFAALLLQVSTLLQPLHLGDAPPELRSARHVLLSFQGAEAAPPGTTRTRAAALERAQDLAARLRAGVDFARTVSEASEAPDARSGGVLGSFAPGVLALEADRFLFAANVGAVSDPIVLPDGVHVFQRIDTWAAVLELRVEGRADDVEARKKVEFVRAEIARGADFGQMAREHSSDRVTAARGGQFAIFERGARDTLVKAAAFELGLGETSAPIRSPIGWHIVRRVPLEGFDPALRENNWARVRAILVQHDKALGADPATTRDQGKAKELVDALLARLKKGEDFGALAREANDDQGGKERGGELGWIHRAMPGLPRAFMTVFAMQKGDAQVFDSTLGFVLVQRVK
ncbi:MAG: peptidylprolyl isomerase [Planctomycetes bacterium]|nr:peptidylprolyl isomerase [Planctomycetota bacterium]